MHNLLVLTADPDQPRHENMIVVKCADGSSQTYHYVETIDGLLHYRHDALPEDQARILIE
jgi:hypothetical protein